MKNRILGFVFLLTLYSGLSLARQLDLTATVEPVKGAVSIQLPGREFTDIKKPTSVPAGTTIRTGAGSEAVIRWSNGNVLKLTSYTTLKVEGLKRDLATGSENSNVYLWNGDVVTKAKKLATAESSFEMRTPLAVAGVRGTSFRAQVTASEDTNFWCIEGSVAVEAQGVQVMVTAGNKTMVQKGQSPEEPEETSEEEQNQNQEMLQDTQGEEETEGNEEGSSPGASTDGSGTTGEGGSDSTTATEPPVHVDREPPVLMITAPVAGTKTRADQIRVMGQAELGAVITVAGSRVVLQADGSFNSMARLVEGENVIVIEARDAANNLSTATGLITRDTTPPMLTVTEPTASFKVEDSSSCQNVGTARVDCRVSGLTESGARLKINNVAYPVGTDGSFSAGISIGFTATQIKVEVSDDLNNTKTMMLSRIIDYSEPVFVTIRAGASQLVSDAQSSAAITVTVKNLIGDPISGAVVYLSVDPMDAGVIVPATAVTDSSGTATATITAGLREVRTTAVINALAGRIPAKVSILFLPHIPGVPNP